MLMARDPIQSSGGNSVRCGEHPGRLTAVGLGAALPAVIRKPAFSPPDRILLPAHLAKRSMVDHSYIYRMSGRAHLAGSSDQLDDALRRQLVTTVDAPLLPLLTPERTFGAASVSKQSREKCVPDACAPNTRGSQIRNGWIGRFGDRREGHEAPVGQIFLTVVRPPGPGAGQTRTERVVNDPTWGLQSEQEAPCGGFAGVARALAFAGVAVAQPEVARLAEVPLRIG